MLKNRDGISLEENRKYKELLFNMDTAKEANDEVSESLRGILRPYQADGFPVDEDVKTMRLLRNPCG